MKSLKSHLHFKFEEKKSRRSEKGDLIDTFLLKINEARVKDGFKKVSFGRMAKLLKGQDLYPFLKECERAKNFSKYFWFKIKQ